LRTPAALAPQSQVDTGSIAIATTSLGITLARPHDAVRASPISAGTGSFFNLPDKEFRYLRTVIVTAAVYRGFSSGLSALPLTFRHRAGVSPYTSPFGFAETCVFSKQSVGPLSCDPRRLRKQVPTPARAPLLPKLRGYFAEFLRQSSLDRLGILFPSTSVGLRYGHLRSP
jgi:hypothetical protein